MLNQILLALKKVALTTHQTLLLILGANFIPTQKYIIFMDIIMATESVALNLEFQNKEANSKCKRQGMLKDINLKIKYNRSIEQQKALKEK